jgi:hypothetical protein
MPLPQEESEYSMPSCLSSLTPIVRDKPTLSRMCQEGWKFDDGVANMHSRIFFHRPGCHRMYVFLSAKPGPWNVTDEAVYGSASRTRVVDFKVDFTCAKGRRRIFTIDGKGPSSMPIHVIVLEVKTSSLDAKLQDEILRVQKRASRRAIENSKEPGAPKSIMILDPDHLSAFDLEKWAVEYSYKFTLAYNKNALAYLLAVQYVEKGLPHVSWMMERPMGHR